MYLIQIIAIAIYAIVMLSALIDFKKTVLVWVPLSLLFNPRVCILYQPPVTALTVAVDLSLVMMYFLDKRKKAGSGSGYNGNTYFFTPAVKIMVASYVLSSLFSEIPYTISFNKIIKQLIDYFGILFILFKCLNTKKDLILFTKALIISALIFTIDGIVEGITKINPIGAFIYLNTPDTEDMTSRSFYNPFGEGQMRFGMSRCFSVFGLHLQFGFACCVALYLILILQKERFQLFKKINNSNFIYFTILALLGTGIIFSNSKGPMICGLLIILSRYKFQDLINIWTITPLIIGFILIYIYMPDYFNNFLSLFDSDLAEEGKGSSVALRERQFQVAFTLFERNPLFGSGINAASYFQSNGFEDLLGAESIWLKLLPDQGVFGVFSYLFMYYVIYKTSKNIIPQNVLIFFLLAIFAMDTTNGSSYGKIIWWMSMLLAVRRYYEIKYEINYNNYEKI